MSISLVQHAASGVFGSNVAAGNLLLVVAANSSGSAFSISDTLGNSWNATTVNVIGSTSGSVQLWWCKAKSSGANTVSVTNGTLLFVSEWSGVNAIDQTGTWKTGTATSQTSNSITTSAAAELLIGVSAWSTTAGTITSVTAGGSQTLVNSSGAGTTLALLVEYQILSSTGGYTVASSNVNGKSSATSWSINAFSFYSGPAAKSSAWLFGF
jgi:hypothetical protein